MVKVEYLLLFLIAIFLFYSLSNCGCRDGFSVGVQNDCSKLNLNMIGDDCNHYNANKSMCDINSFISYNVSTRQLEKYKCTYDTNDKCNGMTNNISLCTEQNDHFFPSSITVKINDIPGNPNNINGTYKLNMNTECIYKVQHECFSKKLTTMNKIESAKYITDFYNNKTPRAGATLEPYYTNNVNKPGTFQKKNWLDLYAYTDNGNNSQPFEFIWEDNENYENDVTLFIKIRYDISPKNIDNIITKHYKNATNYKDFLINILNDTNYMIALFIYPNEKILDGKPSNYITIH